MNLEIKKMSCFDFLTSSYETEKIKIWISIVVIWFYIAYDVWHKSKGTLSIKDLFVNIIPSGLLISLGINVFVYLIVYFIKYKRALKESPVIKAQISENFIRNFYLFGDKQKYSIKKYSEFTKIYEKNNGFYFILTKRSALFLPKKGLSEEENSYVGKLVNKYKSTGKKNDKTKGKKKK